MHTASAIVTRRVHENTVWYKCAGEHSVLLGSTRQRETTGAERRLIRKRRRDAPAATALLHGGMQPHAAWCHSGTQQQ